MSSISDVIQYGIFVEPSKYHDLKAVSKRDVLYINIPILKGRLFVPYFCSGSSDRMRELLTSLDESYTYYTICIGDGLAPLMVKSVSQTFKAQRFSENIKKAIIGGRESFYVGANALFDSHGVPLFIGGKSYVENTTIPTCIINRDVYTNDDTVSKFIRTSLFKVALSSGDVEVLTMPKEEPKGPIISETLTLGLINNAELLFA